MFRFIHFAGGQTNAPFSNATQQTSSGTDYANSWSEEKTFINNIHEIVMISSNVHLFIDLGWKNEVDLLNRLDVQECKNMG